MYIKAYKTRLWGRDTKYGSNETYRATVVLSSFLIFLVYLNRFLEGPSSARTGGRTSCGGSVGKKKVKERKQLYSADARTICLLLLSRRFDLLPNIIEHTHDHTH